MHNVSDDRFRWPLALLVLAVIAATQNTYAESISIARIRHEAMQLQDSKAVGPSVTITGVITEEPVVLTGEAASTYLQDATGGIRLFTSDVSLLFGPVHEGDVVLVQGVLAFRGSPELRVTSVSASQGHAIAVPAEVSARQLQSGEYDGRLVQVNGRLLEKTENRAAAFAVRDKTGEVAVEIQPRLLLDREFADRLGKGGKVQLLGIGDTRCASAGCKPVFYLEPRTRSDVEFAFQPPYGALLGMVGGFAAVFVLWQLWSQRRRVLADARRTARAADVEQKRAEFFRQVAAAAPLRDVLQYLTAFVEAQISGSCCVILLPANIDTPPLITSGEALPLPAEFPRDMDAMGLLPEAARHKRVRAAAIKDDRFLSQLAISLNINAESACCAAIFAGREDPSGYLVVLGAQLGASKQAIAESAARMAAVAIDHAKLAEKLAFQAQHDFLTGLPNRALLRDRLEQAMNFCKRRGNCLAVVILDLDGFKSINDTQGHRAGDELLARVAIRLSSMVRSTDTVARLGGDEFVIVLTELRSREDATRILDNCIAAMNEPLGEDKAMISCSLGVSFYPEDGRTAEELMQRADLAMYEAKEAGKATYRLFEFDMVSQAERRLRIANELQRACTNQEFVLFYQPQLSPEGVVVGVEALLRWQHPAEGLLAPGEFIEVAETSGLILPIGRWVLREACTKLAEWHRRGLEITMAVNVSAKQFDRSDFVEEVVDALRSTSAPAAFLELELTETAVLSDVSDAARKIRALSEWGVACTIDDFGTGHSSLRYLHELNVAAIKIDRSFVMGCASAEPSAAIVESTISLAQRLGIRFVAEGVEKDDQLGVLLNMGCRFFQGFLFSKPLPVEACEALLETSARPHEAEAACFI